MTQLFDSAYYLSTAYPKEDCPFVATILTKVIGDFDIVYEYLKGRIVDLMCNIV